MISLSQFKLSKSQLTKVKQRFTQGHGLGNYPSYVFLDKNPRSGEYTAIELGGTNLRAARIKLNNFQTTIADIITREAPCTEISCSPTEFFSQIIDRIKPILSDNTPIGFTFSFAVKVLRPSQDAQALDGRLLYWTKGIKVPGLVGKFIAAEFNKVLSLHGYRIPRIVLLNDTVATLISGINHQPTAGLVVGTGMNLAVTDKDNQAINTEAGNLKVKDLSIWTDIDEELDKISPDPSTNSFEKLVSGKYLPLTYNKLTKSNIDSARLMVKLMLKGDKIAKLLFTRSAQLIGAILSSTIEMNSKGQTLRVQTPTIVAEGTVFWEVPKYKDTVSATIHKLTGKKVNFLKVKNPGLIGAGIAVGLADGLNNI